MPFDLEKELIKIGAMDPDVRPHIREILSAYRLSDSDKKVIDAFVRGRRAEGRILLSDGKILGKMGPGRERVARWRGKHIVVLSTESVKSDEVILRYLTKVGKGLVLYSYKRNGNPESLRFQAGGDVLGDQWDGWIRAWVPEKDMPVGALFWTKWREEYSIRMVEVDPEYRRTGVATELYRELFRRERIKVRDLSTGFRTEDGQKFRGRLNF